MGLLHKTMKKIRKTLLAVLMTALLAVLAIGCGKTEDAPNPTDVPAIPTAAPTAVPTAQPTAEPAPEVTPEPTPTPEPSVRTDCRTVTGSSVLYVVSDGLVSTETCSYLGFGNYNVVLCRVIDENAVSDDGSEGDGEGEPEGEFEGDAEGDAVNDEDGGWAGSNYYDGEDEGYDGYWEDGYWDYDYDYYYYDDGYVTLLTVFDNLGNKVAEQTFGVGAYYSMSLLPVSDELFAIVDYSVPSCTLYDAELNCVSELTEGLGEAFFNTPFFSEDGKYCYFADGINVFRTDFATGTRETVYSGLSSDTNVRSLLDGRYLLLATLDYSYNDRGIKAIDLETGGEVFGEPAGSQYLYSPDMKELVRSVETPYASLGLYKLDGELPFPDLVKPDEDIDEYDSVCTVEEPDILFRLTSSGELNNDVLIDWTNRRLITVNRIWTSGDGYSELRSYNLDDGTLTALSLINSSSNYGWNDFLLDDSNGLLYITDHHDDTISLYAWDYLAGEIEDMSKLLPKFGMIDEEIDKRRKELEQKYNMNIYLGSEIFAGDFTYKLTVCSDKDLIMTSFDKLEEVFSIYPEGFFDQLRVESIRTLGIYFCAGFTKVTDDSIDSAIALASSNYYERQLALDLNFQSDLKASIVHEISHWIDHTIESANVFGVATEFESDWLTLNPSDFSYRYDYNNGKSYWEYTYDSDNPEKCWFVDDYAQTYPTEDRARIFENLIYPESYDYFTSSHLRDKARYFFGVIREAFDTTGWPEETVWEQKLREADEAAQKAEEEAAGAASSETDSTEEQSSESEPAA